MTHPHIYHAYVDRARGAPLSSMIGGMTFYYLFIYFTAHSFFVTTGVLGLLGSIIVLASAARYRSLRSTVSGQLIIFQTMCFFLECTVVVLFPAEIHITCMIQAFCTQYAWLAGALWGAAIVHCIYQITKNSGSGNMNKFNPNDFLKYYHFICWFVILFVYCLFFVLLMNK